MVSRQGWPSGPTELARRSGLTRPTVQRSLAQLSASRWDPPDRLPPGPRVTIPGALPGDRTVGVHGRVLFGILRLILQGNTSYALLSARTGWNVRTVRRAMTELINAGWLNVEQRNQQAPLCFELLNAETARGEAALAVAQHRLEQAEFRGEALMREFLSLLVESEEHEDDAAPGFLVNPETNERLQFDRFYPRAGVAFEFNGPHHYGPTSTVSARKSAKQQARDLMKIGICVRRGISLIVVHQADLSLKGMQAKVSRLLPLRDLHGYDPLIRFLERAGRKYRQTAKKP